MQTVLYYTSTYFLDISLEMIKVLKNKVNLHVLIEITPPSKNANILNIEALPDDKVLCKPKDLLEAKDLAYIQPFLDGVKSVHFVVHSHHTGVSFNTLKTVKVVKNYINSIHPDILHLEAYSLRTVALFPLFFKIKKRLIAVHDAVLHSGETKLKTILPRRVFYNLPVYKTFVFYSRFSMEQFNEEAKKIKGGRCLVKMQPFSFYKSIANGTPATHDHLLFFGRISKYKGLDVLLDALPEIFKKFPDEKLVIAGSGADNNLLGHPTLKNFPGNIKFLNRYIPNKELTRLISGAKMVICPYKDASQSGVLMTTFALSRPAIASDVGAFSESIDPGINGELVAPEDAGLLADTIIKALETKNYLKWEASLRGSNLQNPWEDSIAPLLKIYNS